MQTNPTTKEFSSATARERSENDKTGNPATQAATQAKEKIGQAAEQIKQEASHAASTAKEQVSEKVDQAKEQATGAANEQKQQVTNRLHDVAHALRQSSEELRHRQDDAFAGYTQSAADQVEQFAGYLEHRDVGDLWQGVKDFAHRQPEIFVAGSLAAGFFLGRFFKSTQQRADEREARTGYNSTNASARSFGTTDATRQAASGSYQNPYASQGNGDAMQRAAQRSQSQAGQPYEAPYEPVPVSGKETDWGVDYTHTELGKPKTLDPINPEYPELSKAEHLKPIEEKPSQAASYTARHTQERPKGNDDAQDAENKKGAKDDHTNDSH